MLKMSKIQDIWGGSLSITPLLRKVWNMQFILVCTDYNTSWKSNIPYPGVKYIVRRTCWREIFYFLNGSKDQATSKNICKGENESFPEDSRSLAPKWINQTNLVSCTCYNLPATCNPFCWQSVLESENKLFFFISLWYFCVLQFWQSSSYMMAFSWQYISERIWLKISTQIMEK